MTTENQNKQENKGKKPQYRICKRVWDNRANKHRYETIGVAWDREDGGFTIKPYGTQIMEGNFGVYPITDENDAEVGA